MLAILDYKAGNQTSGAARPGPSGAFPWRITADPAVIADASGIIFPGVGAAGQAMHELTSTGLDKLLAAQVAAGKPCSASAWVARSCSTTARENDTKALASSPARVAMFSPGPPPTENGQPIRHPRTNGLGTG